MRKEIVRCDVCGKTDDISTFHNMIPEGWLEYHISPNLHYFQVCPECANKMLKSVK